MKGEKTIAERFGWLPVAAVAEEVNASLRRTPRLVVTAPPGAGKSTLLPLSILEGMKAQAAEKGKGFNGAARQCDLAVDGKILMLEPRRLAARQVAIRMAAMIGEPVGRTVGYRVRFETRVSEATRVEVITEGILERMLVADPTLEGVSAVIFDEYHERSLTSDVSLALTLEAQEIVRPDLRIIVMSATLDADALCQRLDAPHIHSEGKLFDVETIYGDDIDPRDCAQAVASAVRKAHRTHQGDILAFLPGQAEIMKCAELLTDLPGETRVLPLYGMLPPEQQRRVLTPADNGERRVVLATPIAETSLTIEGIRIVVDSGLFRTLVYDPASGLSRLTTAKISLDMARQRAGRAGRLSEGVCYRLWSRAAEHRMASMREPEILTADLAPMVLDITAWGESDPGRLPWITPPPPGHIAHAQTLLKSLSALDDDGRITTAGRRLAALPCHPRIARMLDSASTPQLRALACDIAALLEEKDPINDEADADITTRIALLRQYRRSRCTGRWQRIADIASQYRRLIECEADNASFNPCAAGRLVALAFPERVAMATTDGRYRLASGEYVGLNEADPLAGNRLLAVASTGSRIYLAAPLSEDFAAEAGRWIENVGWDSRAARAVARSELRIGALIVATRQASGPEVRKLTIDAICRAAPKEGLSMFDFNDDVQALQTRIATLAEWHPELNLPQVDTGSVLATAAEWLPMYIGKANTAQELKKIDMTAVIRGMLSYEQQNALDTLAPASIKLPAGRTARIEYRRGAEAPVVRARLQDCFGLKSTPRLDGGKRPVLMELLSPGFKPVQLTQDMEGFWKTTYFEVRKELRRRYPKHAWPDNP